MSAALTNAPPFPGTMISFQRSMPEHDRADESAGD